MSVSLSVPAFTTVADTLAIAEQRNPGGGKAFVDLGEDKQQYAVETAALDIKALTMTTDGLARTDAAWRLEQANIFHAIDLAPTFGDDPVSEISSSDIRGSVTEETVAAVTIKYAPVAGIATSGSLARFSDRVRELLQPLLVSATTTTRRSYGQGKARRVS